MPYDRAAAPAGLQARLAMMPGSGDGLVFRPLFFRLSRDDDRRGLLDVLARRGAGLHVCDTLVTQLADLVRTRHPSRGVSASEGRAVAAELLRDVPAHEYGVWVYYPWTCRLVHLLDAEEFAELRTNRNRYKITPAEQAVLATRRVGIVGLSAGHAIALTLALERAFGEIRLADFDAIDLSNLNRIQAGVHDIGLPKTCVTARRIAEIDPFLEVTAFPDGITPDNVERFLLDGGRLDIAVEECDSLDIKVLVRQRARDHGIPVVMQTSDRGMLDVERFDREPGRPLFHGLAGELDAAALAALTTEQKIPHVLRIIGADTLSTRARASMIEIGQTISTWPQLASEVTCGGGLAAQAGRRIALDQTHPSGRTFVDPGEPGPHGVPPAAVAPSSARRLGPDPAPAPRSTGRDAVVRSLVSQATRAPSGGNAQPWRWIASARGLHLRLDPARSSGVIDVAFSGSYVALGCAAETLVIAAHAEGLELRLHELPDAADPEHAATFDLTTRTDRARQPRWREELAAQIPRRHCNRSLVRHGALRERDLDALTAAVRSIPSADVQWLTAEAPLRALGELAGSADRMRLLHAQCHREMMAELRWTPAEAAATRDGIDVAALGLSPSDRAGLDVARDWPSMALVRELGGGRGLENLSRRWMCAAGAVGLITMPHRGPAAYFVGGRALQRMWLTATERELAVHPVATLPYFFARLLHADGGGFDGSDIAQLSLLRHRYEQLFRLTPSTAEVLLFRVGVADGPPPPRSLRRPVDEVLTEA